MKIYTIEDTASSQKEIAAIAKEIQNGAILIFPTDTSYALGCLMTNMEGIDKVLRITQKQDKASKLSLICKDLKQVADHTLPYDNHVFKSMKRYLPGPYTFLLNANNSVTKHFKNNKKVIGIRIPNQETLQCLLNILPEPLVSTTLPSPDGISAFNDEFELNEKYGNLVDIAIFSGPIIDGGESTILDCTKESIEVVREGIGIID